MNKRTENFSLSNFSKWMASQQEAPSMEKTMVGLAVEPKVGLQKLISKMDTEGDVYELAEEFKANGGVISEVDGSKIMVEVDSGFFIIHKMYVKKKV